MDSARTASPCGPQGTKPRDRDRGCTQHPRSDTAQMFDALDARSNFEPIMQSVRDLNKLDDG
jgi:hydroxyacylglutathione hydrolase